jgi:hypothetical protein
VISWAQETFLHSSRKYSRAAPLLTDWTDEAGTETYTIIARPSSLLKIKRDPRPTKQVKFAEQASGKYLRRKVELKPLSISSL